VSIFGFAATAQTTSDQSQSRKPLVAEYLVIALTACVLGPAVLIVIRSHARWSSKRLGRSRASVSEPSRPGSPREQ